MDEVWRPVTEDARYEVSNLGRVRSTGIRRRRRSKAGKEFYDTIRPKVLKPQRSTNGYSQICLGGGKRRSVHRLVALAFIDNPMCKREVNHMNGLKWDNRVSNLEWATPLENTRHAFKTGLAKGRPIK